jgi:hypothetical protein
LSSRIVNIVVLIAALIAGFALGWQIQNGGNTFQSSQKVITKIDTVYSSVTDTVVFTETKLKYQRDTITKSDTVMISDNWLPRGFNPDTLKAPLRVYNDLFLSPAFEYSSFGISRRDTIKIKFLFPQMKHDLVVSHGTDSIITRIEYKFIADEKWYNSPWFTVPVCLLSAWLGYELNNGK